MCFLSTTFPNAPASPPPPYFLTSPLLPFTPGRQTTGFHVLGNMWTTSRACAVAFNWPRPLLIGRRCPIRRQCLRSVVKGVNKSGVM